MVSNQYHYPCKTMCKSPCKSTPKLRANFCVKLFFLQNPCIKYLFSTAFSQLSHRLFNNLSISVKPPTFPLLHKPYYHNYKINLIERN